MLRMDHSILFCSCVIYSQCWQSQISCRYNDKVLNYCGHLSCPCITIASGKIYYQFYDVHFNFIIFFVTLTFKLYLYCVDADNNFNVNDVLNDCVIRGHNIK